MARTESLTGLCLRHARLQNSDLPDGNNSYFLLFFRGFSASRLANAPFPDRSTSARSGLNTSPGLRG
jgi:hypothetical protein